jgi:hypothetical protein
MSSHIGRILFCNIHNGSLNRPGTGKYDDVLLQHKPVKETESGIEPPNFRIQVRVMAVETLNWSIMWMKCNSQRLGCADV